MNQTLELLHNRVSLRKYANKPISEQDLDAILEGAMRAPTAGNMMMYSILVIKNEEKKQRLSESCDNQPFIAKAPVILIFLADMQRLYDYFDHCRVQEFCEIKGINYTSSPNYASLFLSISDALIAAQNAVVAAESLNIGSCYIGDITENYELHKELLKLPDKVFPIGMLTLGYYPESMKRVKKSRFVKKYLVFDEEYQSLDPADFANMYKELEEKFVPNNTYNANNFGQILYTKKFGTAFADEMERSINVILRHWMGNK